MNSLPMVMLAANIPNEDAMIEAMTHPIICIAASLTLIVGVIMARRNKNSAVKVLIASIVLYVLALVADPLGLYPMLWVSGIIWSVIAVIFAKRARKHAQINES
ncbi:MAG: hypothetical protein II954_00795 [Synergistaceae bacterium]|nr:hypothetical protein [Synergistaceae bacterium]